MSRPHRRSLPRDPSHWHCASRPFGPSSRCPLGSRRSLLNLTGRRARHPSIRRSSPIWDRGNDKVVLVSASGADVGATAGNDAQASLAVSVKECAQRQRLLADHPDGSHAEGFATRRGSDHDHVAVTQPPQDGQRPNAIFAAIEMASQDRRSFRIAGPRAIGIPADLGGFRGQRHCTGAVDLHRHDRHLQGQPGDGQLTRRACAAAVGRRRGGLVRWPIRNPLLSLSLPHGSTADR